MTILDNLTALEREQLRYIVERVQAWPQYTKCLWVSSVGYIHKDRDVLGGRIFDNALGIDWPTYSPDFTRAQYDAMKAEIKAESGKCVHTEHCCLKHGCKYGDEDCPVYRGEKPQSFPCETCDWEKDMGVIDYRAHCEALAGALEHILEYWNRDKNETAMADALCHIIETADEALTRWKEDSK